MSTDPHPYYMATESLTRHLHFLLPSIETRREDKAESTSTRLPLSDSFIFHGLLAGVVGHTGVERLRGRRADMMIPERGPHKLLLWYYATAMPRRRDASMGFL